MPTKQRSVTAPAVPGSTAVDGVVTMTALRRARLMHSTAPNPPTGVRRRPSLTPAPVSVNYPRGGLVMIGRVARQQSDKTGLLMMPRSALRRRRRLVHIETMKGGRRDMPTATVVTSADAHGFTQTNYLFMY